MKDEIKRRRKGGLIVSGGEWGGENLEIFDKGG
jgi:hypothetical protein